MKVIISLVVLMLSVSTFSQVKIKGTVFNDSTTLELANVYVKNSTKGVVTNDKGKFKIQVNKGDTLVISYLGYMAKELIVVEKRITLKYN